MKRALDFDGTCVTHAFPKIGKDIGAVPILKRLQDKGHQIFLFTMRADRKDYNQTGDPTIQDVIGTFLTDAINWFKERGIELDGIQSDPTQVNWTVSPKCYAELYIDDAGLGCPLVYPKSETGLVQERPFADWVAIEKWLEIRGII